MILSIFKQIITFTVCAEFVRRDTPPSSTGVNCPTWPHLLLHLFDCYCVFILIHSVYTWPLDLEADLHASILSDRKWVSLLTRGCDSVLPGGLVAAQGEQQGLDGSDEDASQAAVENDIKQQNSDCGGEKRKNVLEHLYREECNKCKHKHVLILNFSLLAIIKLYNKFCQRQ